MFATLLRNPATWPSDIDIEYPIPIVNTPWGFNYNPQDLIIIPKDFFYGGNPKGLMLIVGGFTTYTSPNGTLYNSSGNIILNPDWSVYNNNLIFQRNTDFINDRSSIRSVDIIVKNNSTIHNNSIVFGGDFSETSLPIPGSFSSSVYWCVLNNVDTSISSIFNHSGNLKLQGTPQGVFKIKFSSFNKTIHLSGYLKNILLGSSDHRGYYQYNLEEEEYIELPATFGYHRVCRTFEISKIENSVYAIIFYWLETIAGIIQDMVVLFKNSEIVDTYTLRNSTEGLGITSTTNLEYNEGTTLFAFGGFRKFTSGQIPDINSNNITKIRINSTNDVLVFNENFLLGNNTGFNTHSSLWGFNYTTCKLSKLTNNTIMIGINTSGGYYPEPIYTTAKASLYILNEEGQLIYSESRTTTFYSNRMPSLLLKQVNSTTLVASPVTFSNPVYTNGGTSGTILYYRNFGTISINGESYDITM